jgi:acyl carrier protein
MVEDIESAIYTAIRNVRDGVQVHGTLNPDTTFEELSMSSMEFVTLIFQLESRWGISIADSSLPELRTIADARDLILGKLQVENVARELV